ncbi:hypothetical protein ACFL6U_28585 [Planctomycetota bacterium]
MRTVHCSSVRRLMFGVIVCLVLQGQVARASFVFGEPTKVPNFNSSSAEGSPSLSADGLKLYFESPYPHGGDACYSNIWVATRSTVKEVWSTPTKLDINFDGAKTNPCISADELELYFCDGWSAALLSGCKQDSRGLGNGDLWVCTRATIEEPWGDPVNLGPTVNTTLLDDTPAISADGLSLYFSSERDGRYGLTDIYVTTRQSKNDPWGPPTNLGSDINKMGSYTNYPFISPDNLSLYFSRGTLSSNIYVSRRANVTAPWGIPVRFEPVKLSGCEYRLSFTPGCPTLYFSHGNRFTGWSVTAMNATFTSYDIWQVEVTTILDLNGDGFVDTLDVYELLDHWGTTDNSLYDIAPFPLGDSLVDENDLLVLAEHMVKIRDANDF